MNSSLRRSSWLGKTMVRRRGRWPRRWACRRARVRPGVAAHLGPSTAAWLTFGFRTERSIRLQRRGGERSARCARTRRGGWTGSRGLRWLTSPGNEETRRRPRLLRRANTAAWGRFKLGFLGEKMRLGLGFIWGKGFVRSTQQFATKSGGVG